MLEERRNATVEQGRDAVIAGGERANFSYVTAKVVQRIRKKSRYL